MKRTLPIFSILILAIGCQSSADTRSNEKPTRTVEQQRSLDTATFAGGCFWCVEAAFEQIKGVYEAVSGYSGGKAEDADYRRVSAGVTGHAEAVQVYFDPKVIDYETLLDIFFTAHDPTQLNRQGPDVGRQYRTEIFYHNESQKQFAETKIKALASAYQIPIVTIVSPLEAFYKAEEYHQDYEKLHPNQPYIVNVSRPKIERVAKKFGHLLKEE